MWAELCKNGASSVDNIVKALMDNMNDDDGMDGNDLWEEMTRDVKPLKGRGQKARPAPIHSSPPPSLMGREGSVASSKAPSKTPQGHEVDGNTLRRFKKGEMPIEARLDLHGMSQPQAYDALRRFILSSQAAGHRCVIVITGKGLSGGVREPKHWTDPESGVLKRSVPGWLRDPALKPHILQVSPAQPKHGGAGALYVLLRRKRDYAIPPPPDV